ncbi:sigma-70 family RNA polymerase sigma factor [bacterium]|nr:sigma-70 family RNA polymerase sigma factor [candidate division CSSED10-310 bacterium]
MLKVKAGDTGSFELLMKRYKRPLTNYLYRIVGNREASEDIFQEAFLRIYKFSGRYEARSRFSTYLYRIATNLAINELKRRKIRKTVPLIHDSPEGPREDFQYLKHMQEHSEPGADEELESRERIDIVRTGLEKLPPKHRAILMLSEFEELPYEDIADIVGINIGTVKSRIHRAKKNLKEWLKKNELFRS